VKSKEEGSGCLSRERRAVLFLLPITAEGFIQTTKRTLNGPAALNYQDLHGNADYLFEVH